MDRVSAQHHPGYVSLEEFEANQAELLANANQNGEDRRKGPRVKVPPCCKALSFAACASAPDNSF